MCAAKRHVRFTPNSDRKSEFPQTVMSALPPKADMCGATRDVLWANSGHCALFDHLVGAREHRVRHTDSEHLSGLLIDDQLDFGCLHYW
jgi:hypothetical protein